VGGAAQPADENDHSHDRISRAEFCRIVELADHEKADEQQEVTSCGSEVSSAAQLFTGVAHHCECGRTQG
jgi:hypothetical protein